MKKYRKKGYTLIELVAVIAILAILLGSGFTMVGILKKMKSEVELESAVYEVSSILSYAKAYCRKNSYEGVVVIDVVRNSIIFKYKVGNTSSVTVKSENLPNNIKIFSYGINIIDVSNVGYLKNAGTILINSGRKQKHITIAVGNDLITVKDE